jgi:hypothetical protein
MELTPQAIETIAGWQSAYPGFDRDDDLARKVRFRSILDYIGASGDLDCHVLQSGGLSNYAVLFVFFKKDVPSFCLSSSVEGLLVYLSLCAPLAVIGHSRRCVDPDLTSYDPLALEDLLAPDDFRETIEIRTLAAIQSVGYRVLLAEEVSQPLPPGVEPYGYCYAEVPENSVFTALFADTD